MSWTYSGNPDSSALDKVRFLVQDTDSADQQLSDQEVTAMLADSNSNAYIAAIACVRALMSKYTRRADKSVGDLSISWSQIAKGYQALIASLSLQAALSGAAAPYAGGISISDKQIDEANTDRVEPAFKKGLHDFHGEPGPS